MKVILKSEKSFNYLVTIAIGKKYYANWKKKVLNNWKKYCKKNDIGIIVFLDHLIDLKDEKWKKPHWQKLLVGDKIKKSNLKVNNVCWLDTDVHINFLSPNIFKNYNKKKIGLISLRKNLPFDYKVVTRKLAFLRHKHYDKNYPLDSSLFISLKKLYEYHDLPEQADEACTGVIIFNVKNHAKLFTSWFYKYDKEVKGLTTGEQTHLNYEIQNYGKVQWLDYKFQAIWAFEMAWNYPFLYYYSSNKSIVKECIESSLRNNYFLHFAGSWNESEMSNLGNFFDDKRKIKLMQDFEKYLSKSLSGKPVGLLVPKNKKK